MHSRVNQLSGAQEADALCSRLMPKNNLQGLGREVVFPGREAVTSETFSESWSSLGSEVRSATSNLYVVGCATYKSSVTPEIWQFTQIIFEIDRRGLTTRNIQEVNGRERVPLQELYFNGLLYPQKAN